MEEIRILTEEERRPSYKKDISDMGFQDIVNILLTTDGKGAEFKRKCLEKLINKSYKIDYEH